MKKIKKAILWLWIAALKRLMTWSDAHDEPFFLCGQITRWDKETNNGVILVKIDDVIRLLPVHFNCDRGAHGNKLGKTLGFYIGYDSKDKRLEIDGIVYMGALNKKS